MSKKIWRVYGDIKPHSATATSFRIYIDEKTDCTVIVDSVCFPVREAMAFCKTYFDMQEANLCQVALMSRMEKFRKAHDRYIKAVARMKAKKGSK